MLVVKVKLLCPLFYTAPTSLPTGLRVHTGQFPACWECPGELFLSCPLVPSCLPVQHLRGSPSANAPVPCTQWPGWFTLPHWNGCWGRTVSLALVPKWPHHCLRKQGRNHRHHRYLCVSHLWCSLLLDYFIAQLYLATDGLVAALLATRCPCPPVRVS